MHELPKDLTSSLRSYRGSMYGKSHHGAGDGIADDVDLERGPEDYEDEDIDRALSGTEHSPNLHSTAHMREMAHTRQEQASEEERVQTRNEKLRFDKGSRSRERPKVDTKIDAVKNQHSATARTPATKSIFDSPPVRDPDPAADRLAEDMTPLTTEDFYDLMGMQPATSLEHDETKLKHLARPSGLFSRIVQSTSYENRKYKAFAITVYVFLVLQLVISAVFIILGSLRGIDTHVTIAVLGAVSTVIAGGLALMQGQGLPYRLRQTRDALRNVVFEAEELYWDMRSGRPILYEDVKKIREDYLRVMEERKMNQPDSWNSTSQNIAQGSARVVRGKR
ncbi:hypothetical protein LTR37_004193 [Vermiconidia calcicola]|uniref:Uncharacterized protein n=1 Tax=Vermiconidia calcicola TaxID=1690605 RepID=A0ACC3NMG9_9PEZI|nr:hypothetical protein LTR37_004193 [Vermiconidia calcicola]